MKKRFWIGAALLVTAAVVAGKTQLMLPKGAVVVKPFDKEKYLGKWYEIARMDFKFERNMNNVTANYSMNENGYIRVVNRGYETIKKEWKDAVGKAKFSGSPDEARLKVSFFGPFYAAYNVIALDDQYKYALVCGKNLSYLWILSRETTIPEDIKQQYLDLAQKIGFNTSALVWVEHNSQQ
jgi:apolipoprotein D and lipocalin family protein